MNTKEENKQLLIKMVKAENALEALWLIMDQYKESYDHLSVDEVINDMHKIRDKISLALGRELCCEKQNVLEEDYDRSN